jgi:hypothetical protein
VEWQGGTTFDGKGDDFSLGLWRALGDVPVEVVVEVCDRELLDEARVLAGLSIPYAISAPVFIFFGISAGGEERIGWYARAGSAGYVLSTRSVDWAVIHDSRDGTRCELIAGLGSWQFAAAWTDLRGAGTGWSLGVDYRF